jgi:hypothetical protein
MIAASERIQYPQKTWDDHRPAERRAIENRNKRIKSLQAKVRVYPPISGVDHALNWIERDLKIEPCRDSAITMERLERAEVAYAMLTAGEQRLRKKRDIPCYY